MLSIRNSPTQGLLFSCASGPEGLRLEVVPWVISRTRLRA